MIKNMVFEATSPFEKPFVYDPKPSLSLKDGEKNNQKVSKKHLVISDNAVSPQIQCSLTYKIDVVKSSELYRQLPKSIKARLPFTVWSSNPMYSRWVAKNGVFFKPSNKSDNEPVGRCMSLVDSTTGKELLIDCFDKPDSEIVNNLQQELKLFKQRGFGKKLRTKKLRIGGRNYQVIDDSVIHLDTCPELTFDWNK